MKTLGLILVIIVAIIIAVFAIRFYTPGSGTATVGQPLTTVTYECSQDKSITAAYYEGTSTASTDSTQPPMPGGSVMLTLSDGRTMTLPQTISADGARYANAGETVVFWNKGNGITFTENGQQTFTGCIQVADDPGGLSEAYVNGTEGFSLRYPQGFTVDENYTYQELGPGKSISGVKFTIPATMATGTNLSTDTYVSVEEIPQVQSCTADLFLGAGAKVSTITDGDTTYSFASTTGAGAGNRYEEDVYALPGTSPCVAVRYFIHYGVLANYPAGTVTAFDENALMAQFDAVRRTLTLAQ